MEAQEVYLKSLSNNLLNLTEMLEVLILKPILADKKAIYEFYKEEAAKFDVLKQNPLYAEYQFPDIQLSDDLMFHFPEEVLVQDVHTVGSQLGKLMAKVQSERKNNNPDFIPVTGFDKDSYELRDHLAELRSIKLGRKNKKKIVEEYEFEISKTPMEEYEGLALCSDGLVRYKGELVDLESSWINVLGVLIEHGGMRANYDDLEDRTKLTRETISKYTSRINQRLNRVKGCTLQCVNQRPYGYILKSIY